MYGGVPSFPRKKTYYEKSLAQILQWYGILNLYCQPNNLSSGVFILLDTSLIPFSSDLVHGLVLSLVQDVDRQGFGVYIEEGIWKEFS